MFVYLFLTAQLKESIEENLWMWTAGEEMAEYPFHFVGIRMTNTVELETIKKNMSSKWSFIIHNQ